MNRLSTVLAALVLTATTSCSFLDKDESENTKDNLLSVIFTNDSTSAYPITSIELRDMGFLPAPSPSNKWGTNILGDDTLFPGEHFAFILDLPTQHFNQFRLAVLDSTGTEIHLHEQTGWNDTTVQGTITHWGSDFRNVKVTIAKNIPDSLIYISYSEDYAATGK